MYSYGFKEGQPWGDDRRAMESALRAMDQLEREIQQNYIYNQTTPSNPWVPYPTSSRGGYIDPSSGGGYYQPRAPADIRINRSNASDASQSSSGSEIARWPGRQEEYDYHGPANGGYSGHSGRPDRSYYHHREAPAASFHTPSAPRSHSHSQGRSRNVYAPPLTPFNSSYSRYHTSDDNPAGFPEEPPIPSLSPGNMSPASDDHGHRLLIGYGGGGGESQTHEDADHDSIPPSSPNALAPEWSMETTRGTENLSNNSSLGYHSGGLAHSGYNYERSSGSIESYNHEYSQEGYRDYLEDAEHGYMSDGGASDEGVYYSSDEGPYSEGGAYSDEGYSSFSDYYEDEDDDFYGGASDSD